MDYHRLSLLWSGEHLLFLFEPLSYPTLSIEFHHGKDAESDSDGSLERGKTRMEGIWKLVGNDIVACPKDACTWHQGKDAADKEHRDGAFPSYRLQ